MQPGMIILWYGSELEIPDGWVICDGIDPAVALLDWFVAGAGGSYNPGDGWAVENHGHTETYLTHAHSFVAGAWMYLGGLFWDLVSMGFDTFTSDGSKSEPPYHALYFIQKT